MKYALLAVTTLFVVMAHAPVANAAMCPGGVYNAACVAGAYDYVVVRRGPVYRRPAVVYRRPAYRRPVVVVR